MEILSIFSWSIPYTRAMADSDYDHFIKSKHWSLRDAVMLSLGFNPVRQAVPLIESEAKTIGLQVRDRWDLVDKAMRSGDLPYIVRRYKLGSEDKEYAVEVRAYISWLQANKLSCPEGLVEAIQQHDPYQVQEADVDENTQEETIEGQPTSVIPDTRDEHSKLFSELGSRKGQNIRDLKHQITTYAEGELDLGCICMHREQADFLMKKKRGNQLHFVDPRPESKRKVSPRKYFIEAVKQAHLNKGRAIYGATPGFKRTPGQCPVHRDRKS